ncbi:ABC transporter ATP-binding protein [Alicyclobacillus pomorum]|uniref:ABC transporter ATP-binding protein n=1 Tax=Alicyclobacillus pomorum TaxID=204470 RepID=UPI0004014E85|nr:ABC transporter ATP-binding protein [Alicyclobacillus pomorum]
MKHVLELDGVHANIGQFQILQGVSFRVPEHQVTVLMGRNGAGKTTTLRTIMGYVRPRAGHIRMNGAAIGDLSTHQIARRGIAYLPEENHVFHRLTVAENLQMADRRARDGHHPERVERMMDLFGDLRRAWCRPAGSLSGGQKQMLAMASALISEQPVLLIDEPSKGLSPGYVHRLVEILQGLKGSRTVLLVEQNVWLAGQVADTFVMLDDGRTVLSGNMQELLQREDWQQQFLGVHATRGER